MGPPHFDGGLERFRADASVVLYNSAISCTRSFSGYCTLLPLRRSAAHHATGAVTTTSPSSRLRTCSSSYGCIYRFVVFCFRWHFLRCWRLFTARFVVGSFTHHSFATNAFSVCAVRITAHRFSSFQRQMLLLRATRVPPRNRVPLHAHLRICAANQITHFRTFYSYCTYCISLHFIFHRLFVARRQRHQSNVAWKNLRWRGSVNPLGDRRSR